MKNATAKEKESVTLSCKFSATAKEVCWYKGQTLLEMSKKYRMRQDVARVELIIMDLVGGDSGEYRCQAGPAETKATLTVEGQKSETYSSWCFFHIVNRYFVSVDVKKVISGSPIMDSQVPFSPCYGSLKTMNVSTNYNLSPVTTERKVNVTKHLQDIQVDEDGDATFTCELNYADEELQWLLNDRVLCSNDVNEIQHMGKAHALTLRRLAPEDGGTITIKVREIKESASLKVKGKNYK